MEIAMEIAISYPRRYARSTTVQALGRAQRVWHILPRDPLPQSEVAYRTLCGKVLYLDGQRAEEGHLDHYTLPCSGCQQRVNVYYTHFAPPRGTVTP
jgi:hypothetical protein